MDYLVHHGILGMKWGVRRYQNEDGTLTEAGQRRYNKLQSKMEKLSPKQAEKTEPAVKKNPKQMSDEELKEAIARMRSEKEYSDLYNTLHPVKPSFLGNVFGRTFDKLQTETIPNLVNKTISDTASNFIGKYAGKKIDEFIDKKFLTDSEKLKRAADDATNKYNSINRNMLADLLKKGELEPKRDEKLK